MSDLTEFLLARIDEVEAAQRDNQSRWHEGYCYVTFNELASSDDCDCRLDLHVLAECEAKRRIVAEYRMCDERVGPSYALGALARSLRSLAAPYADHPDFDPSWAVTDEGETP